MKSTIIAILVLATLAMLAAAQAPVSTCVKEGGACADNQRTTCSTGFVAGKCPGAANIQCCMGLINPRTTTSSSASTSTTSSSSSSSSAASAAAASVTSSASASSAPRYKDFETCYPLGDPNTIKDDPVGLCNHGWIENTCAVRMSHTFNCVAKKLGSKFLIPPRPNQHIVACKGDLKGQKVIYRVRELKPEIEKILGKPIIFKGKGSEGRGVDVSELAGRKGVIYFDTTGYWGDATGHFDLWTGSYIYAKGNVPQTTQHHFAISKAVYFWPLA